MFSQNFKIFKYSRKIKENIFFSTKFINYVIKKQSKPSLSFLFSPISSKNQIYFISNYFKQSFFLKKKKKILQFSKKTVFEDKETLLSLLVKSRFCINYREAKNLIWQNKVFINGKKVVSPFTLIKKGDTLSMQILPHPTEDYKKIEFFSYKGNYKVITKIPNNYEISFYAQKIIKI